MAEWPSSAAPVPERQQEFARKARRLLRREGRRSSINSREVETPTLRITLVTVINHQTVHLTVWHNKYCVYRDIDGELTRWAPKSAMQAAYDDLCRHMILDDLADV